MTPQPWVEYAAKVLEREQRRAPRRVLPAGRGPAYPDKPFEQDTFFLLSPEGDRWYVFTHGQWEERYPR